MADDLHTESLLLVVVGAHLLAERDDRAIATDLCGSLRRRATDRGLAVTPIVLTDLWQLNEPKLAHAPRIAVGPPHHNAVTAALTAGLPSVLAIDDELVVQLDPELIEPIACCWGTTAEQTRRASDYFQKAWLDPFLDAAERMVA